MNSRHRKTLEAVFAEPARSNIAWVDVEALLVAAGCYVKEGSGSRVKFEYGILTWSAHRPHPGKEAIRYQIREAKEFLERIGILP